MWTEKVSRRPNDPLRAYKLDQICLHNNELEENHRQRVKRELHSKKGKQHGSGLAGMMFEGQDQELRLCHITDGREFILCHVIGATREIQHPLKLFFKKSGKLCI